MNRFETMVDYNWKDVSRWLFWRACLAEMIGTSFLVFMGCGSVLGGGWLEPTIVQISLTFGLVIASMVRAIGHISGGHINPAVTISCLLTRKITLIRALCYVAAQCIGGVIGSSLLKGLVPVEHQGTLGLTTVIHDLKPFPNAVAIEGAMTFLLVFVIFACCDANREDLQGSAPLTIGLAAVVSLLFGIKYTGTSMNPARTFGPAVVTGIWSDHYVYWAGPVLGGLVAAFFYEFIFAANSCGKKLRDFISDPHYDADCLYTHPQGHIKADDCEDFRDLNH